MYTELHASSAFSFLRGSSLPEDLVERAAQLGYPALALVDRDGVAGAPRFFKAAKAAGIRPIVGAELTLAGGGCLPLLVESRAGYRNLCRADHRHEGRACPRAKARPVPRRARRTERDGLVALPGLDTLGDAAGHRTGWRACSRSSARERRRWTSSATAAASRRRPTRPCWTWPTRLGLPAVATGGVRHAARGGRALLDVFTCIREKRTLAARGPAARRATPSAT